MGRVIQFYIYFKNAHPLKNRIYYSCRSLWFIGLFILFQSFLCSSSPALYAQLASSPWPMFMHDVQHTGQSTLSGPQENTPYWQYKTGSKIVTPPEVAQKLQKLRLPFIANQGQMDEKVRFYANTFGGTVFVTKDGEIVYALPNNSSGFGCRGELHSPNVMRSSKKARKTNITYNL